MRGGMGFCMSVLGATGRGPSSTWLTLSPLGRTCSPTRLYREMRPEQAYSGPMTGLTGGDARYRDDRGEADPTVATALAAYAGGTGGERAVLVALAASRLLVPVVPVLADTGQPAGVPAESASGAAAAPLRRGALPSETGPNATAADACASNAGDKRSELAIPSLVGQDGRLALVAFTCADSLRAWQPGARPVPVPASGVFQTAVAESSAVVIDVAGPVPVTVEGTRLAALAAGSGVPDMHEDPDVWNLVAEAAGRVAPGIRVRLGPPPQGAAFTLELAPPLGAAGPVGPDVAADVADAVYARLGGRVRSAIAVLRQPG
jgi:hypothetical protein